MAGKGKVLNGCLFSGVRVLRAGVCPVIGCGYTGLLELTGLLFIKQHRDVSSACLGKVLGPLSS